MVLALTGAAMLAFPRPTRRWAAFLFGLHLPEGRLERIAAWLLVVLGLAIALLVRAVR